MILEVSAPQSGANSLLSVDTVFGAIQASGSLCLRAPCTSPILQSHPLADLRGAHRLVSPPSSLAPRVLPRGNAGVVENVTDTGSRTPRKVVLRQRADAELPQAIVKPFVFNHQHQGIECSVSPGVTQNIRKTSQCSSGALHVTSSGVFDRFQRYSESVKVMNTGRLLCGMGVLNGALLVSGDAHSRVGRLAETMVSAMAFADSRKG